VEGGGREGRREGGRKGGRDGHCSMEPNTEISGPSGTDSVLQNKLSKCIQVYA